LMPISEKPSREELVFRCAGPNCGILKGHTDRWWLMWPSKEDGRTVLSLCEWDAAVARREGALSVCGEQCAQRLQSMFMSNILEHHIRSTRAAAAAANPT
jgi:hypothetical protein